MDSGIRRGADVVKALALGASAVLVGRPYIYGLAVAGEEGVRRVVRNLIADTDITMANSGRRSVAEVGGQDAKCHPVTDGNKADATNGESKIDLIKTPQTRNGDIPALKGIPMLQQVCPLSLLVQPQPAAPGVIND